MDTYQIDLQALAFLEEKGYQVVKTDSDWPLLIRWIFQRMEKREFPTLYEVWIDLIDVYGKDPIFEASMQMILPGNDPEGIQYLSIRTTFKGLAGMYLDLNRMEKDFYEFKKIIISKKLIKN